MSLRARRRWGGSKEWGWSALCLSGAGGSAISELSGQIAIRALSVGMGVVAAGIARPEPMAAGARRAGKAVLAFGEGGASGSPESRLQSAQELAWAMDEGALALDAWGWSGMYSPRLDPQGWARARRGVGVMREACALARKPFVALLCVDELDEGMADVVEDLARALREGAPKGSKFALGLPHYGDPQERELPFGRQAWFDARWVGRLDSAMWGEEGGARKLGARLAEQLGGAERDRLSSLLEQGRLSGLCEGRGRWVSEGGWSEELSFPYEMDEWARGGPKRGFDCARLFCAERERALLGEAMGGLGADERGGKAARL